MTSIGVVGKPSAGKSTFFTAVADSCAKMAAHPFTTIDPNVSFTYWRIECPCRSRGLVGKCSTQGRTRCLGGIRWLPVKIIDVAGLVPGASEGEGRGVAFLDDLRQAQVLVHVMDASGTTDEKGEATQGYDPVRDHDWLLSEIEAWVFNNVYSRWPQIARKHAAVKASALSTLGPQFTGYGCQPALVGKVLDDLKIYDPVDLTTWGEEDVRNLCNAFVKERFCFFLLLNKADHPNASRNISRIVEKYGETRCFVASAAAECFLKKCAAASLIQYVPGDSTFMSRADAEDEVEFLKSRGSVVPIELQEGLQQLKPIKDIKTSKRLERIKDLVLLRYGGTGVWEAVQAVIDSQKMVVAYPVKSQANYLGLSEDGGVFSDAILLRKGATPLDVAHKIGDGAEHRVLFAEEEDGRRCDLEAPLEGTQVILKFGFGSTRSSQQFKESSGTKSSNKKQPILTKVGNQMNPKHQHQSSIIVDSNNNA